MLLDEQTRLINTSFSGLTICCPIEGTLNIFFYLIFIPEVNIRFLEIKIFYFFMESFFVLAFLFDSKLFYSLMHFG